jgi:hypothetical protein
MVPAGLESIGVDTGLHVLEIGALIWVGVFRLGGMAEAVKQQSAELLKLAATTEDLSRLRITDASDRERMNAIDQRMMMQGQRIDENTKSIGERVTEVSKSINERMNDLSRRIDELRREMGRPPRT